MNAEIEKGRGGSVFPPTKDKGTRAGDQLGTGKYFPTNLLSAFLYFKSFMLKLGPKIEKKTLKRERNFFV